MEQVKLDDGWVPLSTMLRFKRLAELTSNPTVILAALAKSTSGLMEIDPAAKKVRRSKDKPLPELNDETKEEQKSRTVYCKGFPKLAITLDKLLEFFKAYPNVLNVSVLFKISKIFTIFVFKFPFLSLCLDEEVQKR